MKLGFNISLMGYIFRETKKPRRPEKPESPDPLRKEYKKEKTEKSDTPAWIRCSPADLYFYRDKVSSFSTVPLSSVSADGWKIFNLEVSDLKKILFESCFFS